MLCLGKSLIVILNYTLTAEQPDPCGPEPCSPGRTAPDPLPAWGGSGDATYPGGGSPQPKQLGAPDLPGSPGPLPAPDPICYPDPSAGREQTPRLGGSGAATCPQAQVRARLPSFLWKTCPPTAFNAGDVKCALPQQSPRRLLPGCTVGRVLPRCTVQPLAPLTPCALVCYAS